VAVAYALVVGFLVTREPKWRDVPPALAKSAATTSGVFMLIAVLLADEHRAGGVLHPATGGARVDTGREVAQAEARRRRRAVELSVEWWGSLRRPAPEGA
jgi:hypothetical protein